VDLSEWKDLDMQARNAEIFSFIWMSKYKEWSQGLDVSALGEAARLLDYVDAAEWSGYVCRKLGMDPGPLDLPWIFELMHSLGCTRETQDYVMQILINLCPGGAIVGAVLALIFELLGYG
jgi:hypothetical protein